MWFENVQKNSGTRHTNSAVHGETPITTDEHSFFSDFHVKAEIKVMAMA